MYPSEWWCLPIQSAEYHNKKKEEKEGLLWPNNNKDTGPFQITKYQQLFASCNKYQIERDF